MARPVKCRRVCTEPEYNGFLSNGIVSGKETILTVDEYEVIRLVDLEKKTHVQCAAQMGISKTTVTEIYESAREKIADCLVNGKNLIISGGNYRVCDAYSNCGEKTCRIVSHNMEQIVPMEKNADTVRIAVPYDCGDIFQHFGQTKQFKMYDVKDGKLVKEEVAETYGHGHETFVKALLNGRVDVLICGGIGGSAQSAIAEAGIKLYGGICGSADKAVDAYISGKLQYHTDT